MQRTRVAVVRGGPSDQYDLSLRLGSEYLSHIPDRYETRDVFVDRSGQWHVNGRPTMPLAALKDVDAVQLALTGSYGEDGSVQRLLERHQIAFTSSHSLASALSRHKYRAKQTVERMGSRTPHSLVLSVDQINPQFVIELFRTFPQPSIIKPLYGGASLGVSVCNNYNEFIDGLEAAMRVSEHFLLEEYTPGIEVTVMVIENFRGERYYVTPEVAINLPKGERYYTHAMKCDEETRYYDAPSRLDLKEKQMIKEQAIAAHQALGLSGYSTSDFMIGTRGVRYLESNSLPQLTPGSAPREGLASVGVEMPALMDHLITHARSR